MPTEKQAVTGTGWTIFVVSLCAFLLGSAWLSIYSDYREIASCTSQPAVPGQRVVYGEIAKQARSDRYYVLAGGERVYLFATGRDRNLRDAMSSTVGRTGAATFCEKNLLRLEVDGRVVFVNGNTADGLRQFGVASMCFVLFTFVLLRYGHKRISFKK